MTAATPQTRPTNPMLSVLSLRDFRLLWIGQGTSLIGDQFYLIAMPWLVLQLTGDPLALGIAMALTGIPRVICMIFGGAVSDRFSARAIMLVSDLVRLFLMIGLTAMVLTGSVQLWMLYTFAVIFGGASGFFLPASNAIVPTLVPRENLEAGNSIFQGTTQLSSFVGPALAGGVIAWFAHSLTSATGQTNTQSLLGISIAFGIDALTFIISVVTLWMMASSTSHKGPVSTTMFESIRSGMSYLWNDSLLRMGFILIAIANFTFVGPLLVGIPVLAKTRLPEGAMGFGLIMSAYAAGNLTGILSAGGLPKPNGQTMRFFIPVLLVAFGVCLVCLGWITSTWVAVVLLLVVGVGNGFLQITFITFLQRRTPADLLGRVMGLVLVANYGAVPLSQALSGALSKWNLTALFVIGGLLEMLLGVWAVMQPEMRTIGTVLAGQSTGD